MSARNRQPRDLLPAPRFFFPTTADPKYSRVLEELSAAIMSHDRVFPSKSDISSCLSARSSTRHAAKESLAPEASCAASTSVEGRDTTHFSTSRSSLKIQVV